MRASAFDVKGKQRLPFILFVADAWACFRRKHVSMDAVQSPQKLNPKKEHGYERFCSMGQFIGANSIGTATMLGCDLIDSL